MRWRNLYRAARQWWEIHTVFDRKPEEEKQLGIPRHGQKDKIKIDFINFWK
jgi:ABC-type protease/lipase transport system fused ATPase/permease subunit